ncbi:MAG: hypothetical protein KKD38_00420 [Candidatus Delongbacteria bacterium]|nr:hypothetical protein [Candidatus Delongbacteria bacterium]MCG2761356.1 hypothetical protein [Candidatus Delongbacteria bacterium]
MELKLPFGMKDGKLVQVSDVEQGSKCGCICPACAQPLVARKGEINIHHKREIVVREFRKLHRKLEIYNRNVDLVICPLKSKEQNKKRYTNTWVCSECKYACGYELNPDNSNEYLICAGHAKEQYDELFKKYNLQLLKDLK